MERRIISLLDVGRHLKKSEAIEACSECGKTFGQSEET